MSSPIFEVDNLRAHYLTRFGQKIQAVDGVTFSLKEGEILGIAGESGCGKTTLVSACMGLYIPPLHLSSGDVRIDGKSIIGMDVEANRKQVLGKQIAMIPQGALNSLNPTRKIKDLATDMILSHDENADKNAVHERLRGRFAKLGMPAEEVLNSYPVQLPAGIKQRVVIGISTLLDPRVVIADEPTSALDVSTQKAVIRLLFELMDQGIIGSMLFITHELPLLRHVSNNIAVMYAGEFVEVGNIEQVIFDPRMPYTKALMGSMLSAEAGHRSQKPVSIEGAPPNLALKIVGCRFAERCPVARPDCKEKEQVIRIVADRQVRCMYAE
ncbi:MAG TPA: ABC transporter ATP-binding protein [Polyangiaceae bacterium]|jgi:peptide/nickel transport system ATP-binding protein|nr:ABC transporter ATP-binding protein [Polyangiaceae bacterium]